MRLVAPEGTPDPASAEEPSPVGSGAVCPCPPAGGRGASCPLAVHGLTPVAGEGENAALIHPPEGGQASGGPVAGASGGPVAGARGGFSVKALGTLCAVWRSLRRERRCMACSGVFTQLADATGKNAPSQPGGGLKKNHGSGENVVPGDSAVPGENAESGERGGLFCPSCAAMLQRRRLGYCPLCGEPAAWPELPLAVCARCLQAPPPWQSFLFHGVHEGLLRRLLIRLKYQEEVLLGHALGSLLAGHPLLRDIQADVLTPVPLHRARLFRRGFNQALELSRPVAAALDCRLDPGLLLRVKHTPPQKGRGREERRDNAQGAFVAVPAARGKRVLLLDDTLTTGATLAEAAKALLRAGARSVHVAVISRTARLRRP